LQLLNPNPGRKQTKRKRGQFLVNRDTSPAAFTITLTLEQIKRDSPKELVALHAQPVQFHLPHLQFPEFSQNNFFLD
jgi:hypothetical protein